MGTWGLLWPNVEEFKYQHNLLTMDLNTLNNKTSLGINKEREGRERGKFLSQKNVG